MSHADFSPQPGSHWGLLGGAFDPPHNWHLELARKAMQSESLVGVAFLVSSIPPHKAQPSASFTHRVEMLNTHIEGISEFCVCDIEREIAPPGYTIRVVEKLQARFPEVEFSLIIGSDNLAILEQWYEVDKLLKLVTVLIAKRPGGRSIIPEKWRDRIRFIPIEAHAISSTAIRQNISDDESVAKLTSPAVIDYIYEHGLYSAKPRENRDTRD
ncbi:nicotinate (nicotinamide) nucleotide adenylyltransferase [Gemmatimonas aurantiaca]|nr:nicotinate (nicotinamide) nucleotide adenylyltransferase [Gemmatimonas aurantiaca]